MIAGPSSSTSMWSRVSRNSSRNANLSTRFRVHIMQLYFSVIRDIIIRILDPHWAPFGPGSQEASSNADPNLNPLFKKKLYWKYFLSYLINRVYSFIRPLCYRQHCPTVQTPVWDGKGMLIKFGDSDPRFFLAVPASVSHDW